MKEQMILPLEHKDIGLRPQRNNETYYKTAALKTAEELVKQRLLDIYPGETIEFVSESILDAIESSDLSGYQIARYLDDIYGWFINDQMLDILNGVESIIYSLYRADLEEWIRFFNLKPLFKIGDKVSYERHLLNKKEITTGEVVAICNRDATYTIYTESLGHIREGSGKTGVLGVCVPWEQVKQLEQVENSKESIEKLRAESSI